MRTIDLPNVGGRVSERWRLGFLAFPTVLFVILLTDGPRPNHPIDRLALASLGLSIIINLVLYWRFSRRAGIAVNKEGLVSRPPRGRPRRFSWRDIERFELSSGAYFVLRAVSPNGRKTALQWYPRRYETEALSHFYRLTAELGDHHSAAGETLER